MKAAAVAVHSFGLGKLAPARHRKDGETPPPLPKQPEGQRLGALRTICSSFYTSIYGVTITCMLLYRALRVSR